MRKSTSRILAAAEPNGNVDAVEQFGQEACKQGAAAIALLGNLSKNAAPQGYARVLKALAETRLPAFYIPGPEDAPFSEFLREAASFETVYRRLRGVHGTFAMAPRYIVWSGMGGTVTDDPEVVRDELETLRYPGWEVEYRLKFLQDLKDYPKVFLFATHPDHKRMGEKGSSMLAEIIKTYNPRLVFVGGQQQKQVTIGKSLVVAPGSLNDGNFVSVDLRTHELKFSSLQPAKKAA